MRIINKKLQNLHSIVLIVPLKLQVFYVIAV